MGIVCASRHVRQSFDLSPGSLTTSRETLANRHDYGEKLAEAFEELLRRSLEDHQDDSTSDSEDVESELFVSARSSFHFELASAVAGLGIKSQEVSASEPRVANLDTAVAQRV